MLNSYNQKIEINAVSGTLVKNFKDSFMINFHYNSPLAEQLLCKKPTLKKCDNVNEGVVVLQTMILPNNYLLCEVMWKDDFEKMFETEQETQK